MPSVEDWTAFIKTLRARQDELRAEARPYEEKRMFIGRPLPDWQREDLTARHIAAIKGEIASIERTIQRVIAEFGLQDA